MTIAAEAETPATARYDVVDGHILTSFAELVEELGGDPRGLLREVDIDPEAFLAGRLHPSYRQVVELVQLAAARLDCRDFGLRLAKRQAGGILSPLVLVMKNSRTFGEALDYVVSHSYAHSLAASIWLRRSASGETVLGHDILLEGLPDRSQAIEQILLVAHLSAMEVTGGLARARKVTFRHQPVSPLRTYYRCFGCEVRFGQPADAIIFHDQDLARPIFDADRRAYQTAVEFIDAHFPRRRPPVHASVRGMVMHFLDADDCSHERIAAQLNLHPRTLHRRLEAEGTSFRRIKDEVRRDVMLYYLRQTDLDLAQISGKLGFAEQSAMTRYCRRSLSCSPSQLRAQSRAVRPQA